MSPEISTIMLGVRDVDRAKKFYTDGLGAAIKQDYPGFAELSLGDGSSSLALCEWDTAAQHAGVSPEGSGFRGVSFHFITDSSTVVDEVTATVESAGGSVVREPERAEWGYFAWFADPDGYLWKVTTSG